MDIPFAGTSTVSRIVETLPNVLHSPAQKQMRPVYETRNRRRSFERVLELAVSVAALGKVFFCRRGPQISRNDGSRVRWVWESRNGRDNRSLTEHPRNYFRLVVVLPHPGRNRREQMRTQTFNDVQNTQLCTAYNINSILQQLVDV